MSVRVFGQVYASKEDYLTSGFCGGYRSEKDYERGIQNNGYGPEEDDGKMFDY